ncbi:MAG: hypothetical protein ACLR1A_01870 [Eubacterium ventriosum]
MAVIAAVAGAAYKSTDSLTEIIMMTLKMISKISLKTKMKMILKKNKN